MDHKKLDVWILSMDFAVEIYAIANTLPKSEQFGLSSQIKGAARKRTKELIPFCMFHQSWKLIWNYVSN